MEAAKMRLRLFFDNGILNKSHRKDGLKRSWVLLKPQLETISDVVSYLLHAFDLHDSCPNGIILSMGGFVLPPFESTTILKDKDLIRVKRKETRLRVANKATEEAKTFIEDEIIKKPLLRSDVKLLTNEEFDEESGGYQSETDEDEDKAEDSALPVLNVPNGYVASKKRKASKNVESSKKKRQRQATPKKKKKHQNESKQDAMSSPDVTEKCAKDLETKSNAIELEEDREKSIQPTGVPNRAKKVSRNTLRKKVQRHFRKLQRDKTRLDEQCKKQQSVNGTNAYSESKKEAATNIIPQAYEDSDAEGDLVPIVIRPGHIRFTPPGKVKDVQQHIEANGFDIPSSKNVARQGHSAHENAGDLRHNQVAKETYHWNGITNKRKGQKWGQENQQTPSWKESRDYNAHSASTSDTRKRSASSWEESRDFNGRSSSQWDSRKQPADNAYVDLEKLVPLIDLPKVGDIVAYRLLELSSTWCPELSSFRVGKITSFEPESNRIMLVPVSGYPLNLSKKADEEEDDDASGQPPGSSVYNEDGSLEIDFPSLVDVRIVKRGELTQSEGTAVPAANGGSVPSTSKRVNEAQDGSKNVASDVNHPAPANGKKDVWEEISDALSAKKAELLKEDSWNKKETSAKRPWSYRTLRSSAIGPTMARLRAQNGV